ncbi:hypothetical protein EWB00_008638 [Schistosoma japonicum]|uniref:Uncharacterized protein n=1 Tax=Schistosoma japonicum TaxID=6182 RepID=A0A4Z2CPC1_SCHJA|nr:hypothetical protein EWB00_008638 [Schistosoma japonicum]TNN06081.1 hypothetical protein EWB00_008638 [Schistosoma japonicum]
MHYSTTNHCLLLHVDSRQPTSILQPNLSWTFISTSSQVLLILYTSVTDSRFIVFFSLPLHLWPSGFQLKNT